MKTKVRTAGALIFRINIADSLINAIYYIYNHITNYPQLYKLWFNSHICL